MARSLALQNEERTHPCIKELFLYDIVKPEAWLVHTWCLYRWLDEIAPILHCFSSQYASDEILRGKLGLVL